MNPALQPQIAAAVAPTISAMVETAVQDKVRRILGLWKMMSMSMSAMVMASATFNCRMSS